MKVHIAEVQKFVFCLQMSNLPSWIYALVFSVPRLFYCYTMLQRSKKDYEYVHIVIVVMLSVNSYFLALAIPLS